jgi:hypothetical protein
MAIGLARRLARCLTRGPAAGAARGAAGWLGRARLCASVAWLALGCSTPGEDPATPPLEPVAATAGASLPSTGSPTSFTVRGRWPDPGDLTYRLELADGPVDDELFQAAVEEALAIWEEAGPVGFRPAAMGESAHVVIGWRGGAHDGCRPFGSSPERAHAGPVARGTFLHLDAARDWEADDASLGRALRHELGHVLGLGHSRDPAALMALDPVADEPGASDRAGLRSLYGGGAPAASDLRVVRATATGAWRDMAPSLRGVAPATVTGWAVFDTDADGDDEVLVWRTDPAGAGALMIHHFSPGGGGGPVLARTVGPLLGAVPVGSATRFQRAGDGSRWIVSLLLDGTERLRRFDGSGLLVRPTAGDDPWSGGPREDGAPAAAVDRGTTRVVVGDLDGDGVTESVLAGG